MSIYEEKKQRTKQLIQQTFLRMLEEKSFESVTVGDLTKNAKINRGTFYLHYLDKFDLLEQMEQQVFTEMGKYIDELQSHYLSTPTFAKEQEQLANGLFSFIELQAPLLKVFLSDHGRAGFHIRFKNAFSTKVRTNLAQHEGFFNDLKVPEEYFISFITSAFLGLIEQWLQNDLDKSPDEMTACYIDIIAFIQGK